MSAAGPPFDYRSAFSRNLGWVTEAEQERLRHRRVAIAGLGGVGGVHLLALTRLGIGKFHIADHDRFELVNFNRQAGATVDTLGRPKVDVMADMRAPRRRSRRPARQSRRAEPLPRSRAGTPRARCVRALA